ncbi:MAG: DUF1592 domain-containing protein [Myxococcota bacterium]
MWSRSTIVMVLAPLTACTGFIGEPSGTAPGEDERPLAIPFALETGARRLTAAEYDATVEDLLGDTTRPAHIMFPEDAGAPRNPFENDYTTQLGSSAFVEAAAFVAADVAKRFVQDAARLDAYLPCVPSGRSDAACMRQFIESFGRKALRRPLGADDVDRYLGLMEVAQLDYDTFTPTFADSLALVVEAFLQDFELLYRVEVGEQVGDAALLGEFELATRMAFFLWGRGPDDALLDDAAAGHLRDPGPRVEVARRMLADPRALEQLDRFHAQWLGYDNMALSQELVSAMRRETAALLKRVVLDRGGSYWNLFLADETFIDPLLASHYGIPSSASEAAWLPYGDTGRRGILSQGTFLSAFAKFSDTSPTQRGILIRERLMCQPIPPPPPEVNADEPPVSASANPCKAERYEVHRAGACAACHLLTDPVGFGLESFDATGKYRTHDAGRPECVITGEGELGDLGPFRGPGELAQLLVDGGDLEACVVQQVFRFAYGRLEASRGERDYIESLRRKFATGGHDFRELLLALIASDQFARVTSRSDG